ncbi:MAG: RNA-binding protein [Clostridiaceae bacterium]|nr:RNA-binding protein [Clostridiaceae bacterium]
MIGINKEKLLNYARTEEDKLFVRRLMDKAQKSIKGYLTFTHFIDPHQRAIARQVLHELGVKYLFDGGYKDAERVTIAFLPDYFDYNTDSETLEMVRNDPSYPVSLVQISYKKNQYSRELTHRDFLGAVMNLGIKRETLGDILVHDEYSQIIVLTDIADFLENNLYQLGRLSVDVKTVPLTKLVVPALKTTEKTTTVASLRLDAIVAEGFNISRSLASDCIESGKVYLQYEECNNVSKSVEEGQTITLRGKGKIVLCSIGSTSKKNRIFVTFKKFI